MRADSLLVILSVWIGAVVFVNAKVTLETIRNITVVTNECQEWIVGASDVEGMVGDLGSLSRGEQVVLRGGVGDGEEIEDTVAAALDHLCSDLLIELEKPLSTLSTTISPADSCPQITKEFHSFLSSTVKFLHEVQERQMFWQWRSESAVFDKLAWLQGLWASRKTNSQQRSFIEQQMELYSSTGCFGKSKEVLRRDVEIVEYLNDLIDLFA